MSKQIKDVNAAEPKVRVARDRKKTLLHGGFSTLMIIAVIAAVVALNVIASAVETNLGLKLDLTANKIYTLSPLTEDIIKNVKDELIIYSFANDNTQNNLIGKTLERYAALGSKILLHVVDPAKEVTLQRKFSEGGNAVADKTVVITNADQTLFRVIQYSDMYYTDEENNVSYWILEQKLTAAIMFMTSDIQTNLYLLTGHGELVTDPSYQGATENLKSRMEEENYNVQTLDLAMKTPQKGDIVMVIGPNSDLTDAERDAFVAFLDNHGKAVFFLDPLEKPLPNFNAVLDHYMIKVINEQVYETSDSAHTERSRFELVPSIDSHEITDSIINNGNKVYVGNTLSFENYSFTNDLLIYKPLLESSSTSLGIPAADVASDSYDANLGSYIQKSRVVGLCYIEKDGTSMLKDAQTRIAVFGTSELALGQRQTSAGNITIIKNSVNWVDNRLAQLSIDGPQMNAYTLNLYNLSTVKVLVTVAIIVIPVIILGGGVFIWYRRKNL